MHSRTRIGGGAVVAAVVILATGVIGRAQQSAPAPPRTRLGPVPAPTPRVAPAAVPKPVEQVAVKAQAIPPRPAGSFGIVSSGDGGGAVFRDADGGPDEAEAWLGTSGYGIEGFGAVAGGYFKNSVLGQLGWAKLGFGQYGISAYGVVGGSFAGAGNAIEGTAVSGIGGYFSGNHGVEAYGSEYGGYFKDSTTSDTGWAKIGFGNFGIQASGMAAGGSFSGGLRGIEASAASGVAGYFSGTATGVYATASVGASGTGGYFSGWRGVVGYGSDSGGYFQDSTPTDTGWAKLGYGHYGLQAYGRDRGGSFDATNIGVYATASVGASGTAGYFSGYDGVAGYGTNSGGRFVGTGLGVGIRATAASGLAGFFQGFNGIQAWGTTSGGSGVYGYNSNTGSYGYLGKGTYKVFGSGSVSFAQNHPYDRNRVVVYSAPEGDEVATYTRGTARLVNGEARVPLGETFAWVTNPDVGLTVYLTPVGSWSDLYVSEKATSAIVVRSAGGAADTTFDYIVWGLRIGFEDVSVVQEREQDAYIPAMTTHTQLFQKHPELRRYTSLARYETERAQVLGAKALDLDLSASEKLRASIGVFDPAVHTLDVEGNNGAPRRIERRLNISGEVERAPESTPGAGSEGPGGGAGVSQGASSVTEPGYDAYGRSFRSTQRELAFAVEVDGTVEPGDVLVAASDRPGFMRRAVTEGDPAVVGVVAETPGVLLGGPADSTAASTDQSQPGIGHADLAVSGIVRCKVDASYGAIRVGDLLITSRTPGYARTAQAPAPGTVVGKALEPLEVGTGAIRALVMLR